MLFCSEYWYFSPCFEDIHNHTKLLNPNFLPTLVKKITMKKCPSRLILLCADRYISRQHPFQTPTSILTMYSVSLKLPHNPKRAMCTVRRWAMQWESTKRFGHKRKVAATKRFGYKKKVAVTKRFGYKKKVAATKRFGYKKKVAATKRFGYKKKVAATKRFGYKKKVAATKRFGYKRNVAVTKRFGCKRQVSFQCYRQL